MSLIVWESEHYIQSIKSTPLISLSWNAFEHNIKCHTTALARIEGTK